MSAINRPTSRWPSAAKPNSSIHIITPFMTTGKRVNRPLINNQHSAAAQRTTKTRHDVEQLFKLCYSTNVKFDTFQRQVVTGTRIPSARTTPVIQNHLAHSPSNIFDSKHCVSREELSPLDINEQHIINIESKQIPTKRTVQVRLDHSPCASPEMISMPSNSHLIAPENSPSSIQHNEFNESVFARSVENIPTDSLVHNHLKKSKSTIGQHPIPTLPFLTLSLLNNRKDLMTSSHSSISTSTSFQQTKQPHIVTGTAILVRQRSQTKSALNKQRIKSSCQQSNLKTSRASIQYDQPELPICLGARVVSIPSKCSRYVLLTFPQVPVRYNAPSYVERLLLPERFPALFQNIIQNRNNK